MCQPGMQHELGNAVSRFGGEGAVSEPVDDEVPCFKVQWQEEIEAQGQKTVQWEAPLDRSTGGKSIAVTPEERDVSSVRTRSSSKRRLRTPSVVRQQRV